MLGSEEEEGEGFEGFRSWRDTDAVFAVPGGENLGFRIGVLGLGDTVSVGNMESEFFEVDGSIVRDTGSLGGIYDRDFGVFQKHLGVVEDDIGELGGFGVGVDAGGSCSVREEDGGSAEEVAHRGVEKTSAFAVGESLETRIVQVEREDVFRRNVFREEGEGGELPHGQIGFDV